MDAQFQIATDPMVLNACLGKRKAEMAMGNRELRDSKGRAETLHGS